jgi:hypothetical protein
LTIFPPMHWYICFMNNMKAKEKFLSIPKSYAKSALSGARYLKIGLIKNDSLQKGFFSKGKMVLKSPLMEARLLSAIKNISAGAMEIVQIVRAPKRTNQKKLLKKRISKNLNLINATAHRNRCDPEIV